VAGDEGGGAEAGLADVPDAFGFGGGVDADVAGGAASWLSEAARARALASASAWVCAAELGEEEAVAVGEEGESSRDLPVCGAGRRAADRPCLRGR
jgi:hypothetical protein